MHLDLTLRHFTRRAGALLVIGTWLRDDEQQWRPVLALIRASDEFNGNSNPCVVPAGTAWIWSEEIGDPPAAARAAAAFVEILRLSGDPLMNAVRICRVVNDHLPDLILIPPLPPSERSEHLLAEGVIRDDAGQTTEFEIHG